MFDDKFLHLPSMLEPTPISPFREADSAASTAATERSSESESEESVDGQAFTSSILSPTPISPTRPRGSTVTGIVAGALPQRRASAPSMVSPAACLSYAEITDGGNDCDSSISSSNSYSEAIEEGISNAIDEGITEVFGNSDDWDDEDAMNGWGDEDAMMETETSDDSEEEADEEEDWTKGVTYEGEDIVLKNDKFLLEEDLLPPEQAQQQLLELQQQQLARLQYHFADPHRLQLPGVSNFPGPIQRRASAPSRILGKVPFQPLITRSVTFE